MENCEDPMAVYILDVQWRRRTGNQLASVLLSLQL